MQHTDNNIEFSESESIGIDWRFWVVRFLKSWYLFVISLVIFMSIAYLNNRRWKPRYSSSALVIIEDGKGIGGAASQWMQGFNAERGYRNVNNQVIMFGSYDLISRVIERNPDYTIDYYTHGRFRSTNLYKISPFRIERKFVAPQAYFREFRISDIDGEQFEITAEADKSHEEFHCTGKYGEEVENNQFFLTVYKTDFFRQDYPIYFKIFSNDNIVSNYSARLGFDFLMKGASVVKVTIKGEVPNRDCDFLNDLCDAFLEDNLNRKNEAAIRTVEFIDGQMAILADSLRISEARLQDYKSSNFLIASTGGSNLISEYLKVGSTESDIRLQETYLDYIEKYLRDGIAEETLLAPTNMGVNDANLNRLVEEFTEYQFKRREVGEKSPLYAKYTREMENMRDQMFEVLSNIRAGLNIKKNDLQRQNSELERQLQSLPYQQQQFANIQRKFNLNDSYYSQLMQKRTDALIQKASNSPDNIILERARMSSMVNAGEKRKTYTTYLLLALLIPTLIVILRYLLVQTVRTEQELTKISAGRYALAGMIRHTEHHTPVIVDKYPRSSVSEAFRLLRTRIEFVTGKKDKCVVMTTSSHSGEGKTYISVNVAGIYAMTGKRVIVIDLDLRKPSVSNMLSLTVGLGLSSYLAGTADLDEVIHHKDKYKFDILPVGAIPPNPGELIKSDRMLGLIEVLKERYDYIVIDTSPIGLVADAYSIINQVDIVLFVSRCAKTNKSMLKNTLNQLASNNIEKLQLVFNDVNLKKLEYSHYYSGNGAYGNYGAYYGSYSKQSKEEHEKYFKEETCRTK
ncbi:MAG: polysaccharide biosynthesis tyrosine autokinase [Paludibacteraceae bacterium]|nr:polysaccharide biosynthesis tyrosine autokinase [Paludibacteraceae bacterium]